MFSVSWNKQETQVFLPYMNVNLQLAQIPTVLCLQKLLHVAATYPAQSSPPLKLVRLYVFQSQCIFKFTIDPFSSNAQQYRSSNLHQ